MRNILIVNSEQKEVKTTTMLEFFTGTTGVLTLDSVLLSTLIALLWFVRWSVKRWVYKIENTLESIRQEMRGFATASAVGDLEKLSHKLETRIAILEHLIINRGKGERGDYIAFSPAPSTPA
jgi:hypothetical protein